MKKQTRRRIGIGVFVALVALGTGWELEWASSGSHRQDGGAVAAPAKASDAVTAPLPREPWDDLPAATDSSQEYDRSDLLLSQG